MTKKRSSEFLRDEMKILYVILGIKSHEGNISQ